MATINFPANPSTNDTYSFGAKTWVYNGSAWDLQSIGAINATPIGNISPSTGAFTTLSATGNITSGNLTTAGQVSATANVTGGNITTAGLISATANITGGNILTSGLVSATANITGGNILTSGLVSVTGNISSAANISASGNVIATANVYSNNVIVPNQDQVLAYIFAF